VFGAAGCAATAAAAWAPAPPVAAHPLIENIAANAAV
jgi:hypothetical protein